MDDRRTEARTSDFLDPRSSMLDSRFLFSLPTSGVPAMSSFSKRFFVVPMIASAAFVWLTSEARSQGHANRAPKPSQAQARRPAMPSRPIGVVHTPSHNKKPGGALNHHPATPTKSLGGAKHPEITGKAKGTKGGPKPGVDSKGGKKLPPGGTELPPGVSSLPAANSDPRWWDWEDRWGGWEGRWRCCDEHWWRHHGPWWGQGFPASSSPAATSSVSVETQPASGSASDWNVGDIIREMSRANDLEKPGKSLDEPTRREKPENK
jgi:hypothetical protein